MGNTNIALLFWLERNKINIGGFEQCALHSWQQALLLELFVSEPLSSPPTTVAQFHSCHSDIETDGVNHNINTVFGFFS